MRNSLDRRTFSRLALAGALGGRTLLSGRAHAAKLQPLTPGIKICAQLTADFTDQDLAFVRQAGVGYVSIGTGGDKATYDNFARLKQKVEATGVKVWNIGNTNVHNMPEVTLGLPGRDQKIEEYKQYLRNLGKAGIHYTTYAHMGNGIWSTDRETTRGGSTARAFDQSKGGKGHWASKEFALPLTHGRAYTPDEIWANFKYFIKAVVPVAEQEGVRIGIHPDDPPVPVLGGVPRCIFGNFDGYVRALEMANSDNVGVCLCCGTWLEGGKLMGKTVVEAIDHFGKRGKLWKIHFRNVSAPLPHFVETFVDDGYQDMLQVMRALKKVDFRGIAIPDHVPSMEGGPKAAWAYSLGYMKALLAAVNAG